MAEASNLDTGRKLLSRNQKAKKRRKGVEEFKLVIPKAYSIVSPRFPSQTCEPETQGNIRSWRRRL